MSVQTGLSCKWTSDGKQFILENFDLIQDSPGKIYNVAPILCPPSSWLYEFYSREFSHKVRVVVGPAEWGTCIRTIFTSDLIFDITCWNNTLAAYSTPYDIVTFNVVTGNQTAILSDHTKDVYSLAFSLDGSLLVSGSEDKTVKVWDIQTGGVVRTLYGHTSLVQSVAISADNTMVASGSDDQTIRLWDIKIGNCCIIDSHNDYVNTVTFSPTNPKLLLSSSHDDTIQQWDIDGHQIGPPIPGNYVAFSPDGTKFSSCDGKTVTIRDTDSRMIVVEFKSNAYRCCFSPEGRYIAVANNATIYIWDIASHNPCLIQTLIGHIEFINSIIFPSSLTLISVSRDGSIKFWQIFTPSENPVIPHSESTPPTSAPIQFVSLQVKGGLAFSMDSKGVVKTWDILTGCCKKTYKTQAKGVHAADIQLISGRLIIVWYEQKKQKIHILDAEKCQGHSTPTLPVYYSAPSQGQLVQLAVLSR